MILFFLEEIQDRLSLHMHKNENAGGVGILSWAEERKVNGHVPSFHLQGVSALLTKASYCQILLLSLLLNQPQGPPKSEGQDYSGQELQGTAVALAAELLLHMLNAYCTAVKGRWQHPFKGARYLCWACQTAALFPKTSASHEAHMWQCWKRTGLQKYLFPDREKQALEIMRFYLYSLLVVFYLSL